jgi:hypothetical protein
VEDRALTTHTTSMKFAGDCPAGHPEVASAHLLTRAEPIDSTDVDTANRLLFRPRSCDDANALNAGR